MSFVVVYDANVLWSNCVRDLLIRVAQAGLVRARWSTTILDETFRSIKAKRPDLSADRLDRTRKLMCSAVRDSVVTGYEPLIPALELPDQDDRHVLAAAITAGAQVIVTWNLKHFPAEALARWNIEAKSPDDFMVDQLYLDSAAVHRAVQQLTDALKNPPQTVNDVVVTLERNGLVQTAAMLRSG
jgi:predicted nucleic acid-binding protein